MNEYRLIVIGAGPGGYEAALHAANMGMKCAVVEKDKAGGTCLNRGCVPTKTLLHASEIYRGAKEAADMGIHAKEVRVSLKELFHYKQGITETLSNGVESLLKSAKVDLVKGSGKITGPGEVTVTDEAGTETTLKADNILIATGAVPALPPIEGLDGDNVVIVNNYYLEKDKVTDDVVVFGGGLAGCECAVHLGMEGKHVSIVEMRDRLAPDANVRHRPLLMAEIDKYAKVYTNHRGLCVTKEGIVCADADGKEVLIPGTTVICALGQRSRKNLVDELRGTAPFVRVIGDAERVSTITNAVYWGYHAALDI